MIGLNNKKIGFIVDTSSNLKDGQFDDVKVVPLGITIQNGSDVKSYKENVDLPSDALHHAFADKNMSIKTSQATMQDMLKVAQEMCSQYDQVFVFPIHKDLSSNINSWRLLKDDFDNLNIVMTCDIGYSFAWTIKEVKEFLKTNEANEQVVQDFVYKQILPNRVGFLMVEDLAQLIKGGRVKGIKAVIAKLLKIKPVVLFDQNGLTNYDQVRDYEAFFNVLDKHIAEKYNNRQIAKTILFIPKNSPNQSEYLNAYSKHYENGLYDLVDMPNVVVCHTGPQYVAIYVELK